MLLQKEKLQHLNSIAHEGKVVVFATDAEGYIHYTIKQDGFEDSYLNTPADQRTGWEQWKQLEFPNEAEDDASVVEKETEEFTRQDNGEFLMRSRYKTQNESAVAPVQLVSGVGHIYVFRQSKQNTLLVDRFVLDGMTNELTRKLEVRFKRSRQKYKPTEDMKMGASGLQNVDSLDYRDTDNEFFYEPTTELKVIDHLDQGWFSVVQVPTNEHDKYRWHIFAYNSQSQKVQLTTIRASEEGLFDIKDYTVLEPKSDKDVTLVPRSIPGIIQRTLDINGVRVTNGLAATKYDIQQEQETKAGPQLIRTSSKVMLVVPTDQGTAALSFAIASDGTLSQIDETPDTDILRSTQRDVLLPLNTLEEIKAIGDTTPPPQGSITGFSVGTEEDGAEDLVKISSPEAVNLVSGDLVEIQNTIDYNGLYQATKIDEDTFTIELPATQAMGTWETVEEEGGLIFDGMVMAYEKTADGKLKVTASNHGLEDGDQVLLTGTQDYNNTYPIQKIDDANFVIQRQWSPSEAVNVKLESHKRRGIVLDGVKDYIELPPESFPTGNEVTISFWAKGANSLPQATVVFSAVDEQQKDTNIWQFYICLPWSNERVYFNDLNGDAQPKEYKDQWNHWVFTQNAITNEKKIYLNGKLWCKGTGVESLKKVTKLTLGKHGLQNNSYSGTIADLQIWDIARTEKEIKDSMYLQLTGKEVGLVGYWRLGAISEGKERKVVDFSVNANHGIVHGDAYVGGVTLNRNLRDGVPAVKYSNDELVAVSQRATYIEEFEFKVDPEVDVNNADGNGNKIFQLSYWGKTSRSADDKIEISAEQDNFESLGNGWYRTTCRFTIPDGVAMIRTFEIANVRGTWNSLEIRKHHIRLVSDSITEAKYADGLSLISLGTNDQQDSNLIQEKQKLEAKIASVKSSRFKNSELKANIAIQQAKVDQLSAIKTSRYSEYQKEVNSPFNYFCKLKLQSNQLPKQDGYPYLHAQGGTENIVRWSWGQNWQLINQGNGFYKLKLQTNQNNVPNDGKYFLHAQGGTENLVRWSWGQNWQLIDQGNGFYKLKLQTNQNNVPNDGKYFLHAQGGTENIVRWSWGQNWQLEKTSQRTNQKIEIAEKAWREAEKNLVDAQAELQKLQQQNTVNADASNLAAWEQRLQEVMKQATAKDLFNQIGYQEIIQGTLIREKAKIEQQLAALMLSGDAKKIAIQLKEKEISEQEKIIDGLVPQINYWTEEYRRSKLSVTVYRDNDYKGGSRSFGLGEYHNIGSSWNDDIESLRVPYGLRVTLYEDSWFRGFSLTRTGNENNLPYRDQNETTSIKVTTLDGRSSRTDIENQYQQKTNALHDARKKLSSLQDELSGFKLEGGNQLEQIEVLQARLKLVVSEIHSIQDNLHSLNTKLFEVRNKVTQEPLTLSSLAEDTLGLVTQGAALSFVNPTGRLNAIATCEGNVQLSYFDDQGQMRQTLYDATSDSLNTAFEQWIPDNLRTCLNCNNESSVLKLNDPINLTGNSTVEAWFSYPFTEKLYWHVLASSSDDKQEIVAYHGKYLGLRINGIFFDCGYDLEKLSTGWHHLAITTKQQEKISSFYIDGEKVGVTQAKPALQIDGKENLVSLPEMNVDYSVGFTIEAWVNYASLNDSRIIDLGTGSSSTNIVFGNKANTNTLLLTIDGRSVEAPEVLETQKWMHLAATVDGYGNVALYKDGQQISTGKASVPRNINRTQNFIGSSNWLNDGNWDGEIAEVRLWNVPRTPTEIPANLGKTLKGDELGLVGYWQFAEGRAKDSSPKGYDGTIKGTVKSVDLPAKLTSNLYTLGNIAKPDNVKPSDIEQVVSTQPNTALKLNGSNDYVEIPYSSALNTNEFTVSFWVKLTGGTGHRSPLTSRDDYPTRGYIFYASPNNQWQFWVGIGSRWDVATANSNIILNTWTHLAATVQGNQLKLYINGKLEAEETVSNYLLNTARPLRIGAGTTEKSPELLFPGEVAEVRIWNKARTAAEIQADMGLALTGNEPNLAGYWPLRDGSAQDYSPNGNNGSIKGNPQMVPFEKVQAPTTTSSSISHTALKFDGSGDYVEIQNYKGVTGTNPRTVEAWIKTTSVNQAIASWGGNTTSGKWTFRVNEQDKLRVEVNGGYIIGSTPLSDGQWHHVACTWHNDGSPNVTDVKFYVDGQLETISAQLPCAINTGTSRNVFIGNDFFNRYFNGDIAEVRIWNKARTQAEIQADMTKALTGNEPSLVGYWPLRDGSAQDYSANGNNGNIKGNPQTVPFDKVQVPITASSNIKETNPNANHFGKLAEVRIWGIGLSDEEIAVNSKTVLSGNEPGLLAYYPMNEATGNEVRDRSGNNRHATILGASWWGCAAPIGNLGHTVMQFDGKNDHIDCGNGINLANSSFTIDFWAKRNALGQWNIIIGQGQTQAHKGLHIGFQPDNKLTFAFYGNDIDTSTSITDFQWHHWACSYDATNKKRIIYLDGNQIAEQTSSAHYRGTGNLLLGKFMQYGDKAHPFSGQLAEVRIWNKARTPEEIKATMHQHLTGQEAGLIGYWPLNTITPEGATVQTPDLTGNYPGTVHEAILAQDNTLPIGGDALVSSEYNTITIDPATGRKSAMMRRFFASPALNGAKFLSQKRIEQLQLQWIGNAQFAPTLLGYIEGAPPIPTENLTVQPDYNGATSVELNMSEDVDFSWNRAQDAGLGASAEFFLGGDTEGYAGKFYFNKALKGRSGFKGSLDFSYQFLNESNITSSSSNSMSDRLELRGTPEQSVKFSHLGKRFIPKNVGYALVISGLADVFITKLSRSGKMVGYDVRPVDGIPPDVNTITFLINPAYTMNGSLDGMTGSSATSDRFFQHVPQMRSQYGSLYPASYYRLQEAYNLKQAIEREDKRRESYFQQFNARLLDETSLSREMEGGAAPENISIEREEDKANTNLTEEEQKAAEEAKMQQMKEQMEADQEKQSAAVKQKRAEIDTKITDQEKRAHATDSFAGWQKKMENILIRSGKRNIVNTYVWDGDGGMRTEAQSFASTAEHTIGGSFTLNAGLGLDMIVGLSVQVELTALATVNMTQTMSKTESRSKGIELNVDLSGVEHVGITDYKDYPIQPGEKVDRYRFMSFYLEGSTNNFYDFFNFVVDPEWLRSNDEEARALRQAMGKANKTWRVLHRVTYVERPALMGFGRDLRRLQGQDQAADAIVTEFQQLALKQLQIEDKLDMILNYLAEKESEA